MLKNRLKLTVATTILLATCGYAGTVTAPNSINIDVSGDIELKLVREKTKPLGNPSTVDKRTAEVNLNINAKLKNGIQVFTTFKVYDGTQVGADSIDADNKDDGFKTKAAYAIIPFMDGKGKVIAGLAPNNVYGTDAFENGGEDWKAAVFIPIIDGVTVGFVSKIKNEEETDKNRGDSGANAIRVDAKFGDFAFGAKYANGYANKNDGATGVATTTEKKSKVLTGYFTGKIAGFDLGAEYRTCNIDLVGVPSANQPKDKSGYFLSMGKEIGNFTVGLAYIHLTKGMKGGDDFAPGMILDGNVDSSATEDTSAIVVPIEFKLNENLSLTGTYIKADVQGEDATEIDLGATYALGKSTKISFGVGKYDHDINTNDQTNIEATINIEF